MAGLHGGHDAELEQLLGSDPELLALSERIRAARPEPVLDHRFQVVLRARLMAAAEREMARRPVRLRKPWFLRGGSLALGGGALGVAMIAATVASVVLYQPHDGASSPTATSTVSGVTSLDPNSVISVSFTKPMDRAAVLRGLDIRPATSYQASWSAGNTVLTIVPTHHLTANTAYTVTIAHTVARDSAGQAPQQDIHLSFGTASTPTPVIPVKPAPTAPVFAVTALGPVAPASHLDIAADGSVVTGGAPSSPSSGIPDSAAPTATGSAPPSESSSSASSTGTTGSTASARMATVRYPSGGAPVRLGGGGGRVAVSGDGRLVAALVPSGSGASVTVIDAGGGQPTVVGSADSSDGPLVWASPDTVEYVGGGRLRSGNLQGNTRTLAPQSVAAGQTVVLAPGGHTAYLGPAPGETVGQLVDLGTLQSTPLPGASTPVVFSGDGTRLAWVDRSGGSPRVLVAPVSSPATTTTVATLGATDSVSGIALSAQGRRVAVAHSSGPLRAIEVASKSLLASTVLNLDGDLSWSPSGDRLAAVRHDAGGDSLVVAALPGTQPPQAVPDPVPGAAATALHTFMAAQLVLGSDLHALVGSGVDTSALQPTGLSRGYVIRDGINGDGSVSADIRLVADPTGSTPVRSANESLTLNQTSGAWLVSSVSLGPLQADPVGPQVVHLATATAGGQTTLQVTFDSDLDAASVPSAVAIRKPDGTTVDAGIRYDADTRTIIAVVSGPTSVPLHVVIGTQLRDVSGHHLASEYSSPAA